MSECDDEKDYDDRDSDEHEPSLPPMLADDTVSVDSSGHKVYKYRDFGDLEENEEDGASAAGGRVPISATAPSTRGSGESSIRVQKFPVKLYAILAQKEFHEIISWMPHGRAWKVLKPSMFESLVMPLFFEYSNYHSFNRLVNAWSFRRVSSGPDRGAYYHEVRSRQREGGGS
jgi:HSF-type DNA-binding